MKNMGTVCGNTEQAKELVIGKDKVYAYTDIAPAEKDGKIIDGLFSYNEIQYDKDEYIQLMADENKRLSEEITDTQVALCEVYEAVGGAE